MSYLATLGQEVGPGRLVTFTGVITASVSRVGVVVVRGLRSSRSASRLASSCHRGRNSVITDTENLKKKLLLLERIPQALHLCVHLKVLTVE